MTALTLGRRVCDMRSASQECTAPGALRDSVPEPGTWLVNAAPRLRTGWLQVREGQISITLGLRRVFMREASPRPCRSLRPRPHHPLLEYAPAPGTWLW